MTAPGDPPAVGIAAARDRIRDRIAAACARVGRDSSDVTLVAVSKTVPAGRLRDAVAAGLTILGENRVQEAVAKVPEVPGATWHLVGPLQSNKARVALETFDVIQSVGSVELAQRLDRIAGELGRARVPVLLQVNVDRDPAKAGFAAAAMPQALESIAGLGRLELAGLMTIGRFATDPADVRATFVELRSLSESLRRSHARLGGVLSMGMSDDFELAVEEGATTVRVGRALFGERGEGA